MVNNLELEKFINRYLNTEKIRDIASNGLQLEGKEKIKKIALGVSVSMDFLKKAIKEKADAILVHHGIFWGYPLLIRSYVKDRIKFMLENNLNLFAYHLPLDLHEKVGNNISIIKLLEQEIGLTDIKPFGDYKGTKIGYQAKIDETESKQIKEILTATLGKELAFLRQKRAKVKDIAVVSGGAGDLLEEAITKDIDMFITGEIEEYTQALSRETGIDYLALGHYNSEKLGVQNLAHILEKEFDIETVFIDVPNHA